MDVVPSSSRSASACGKKHTTLEIELHYLIAKYLSAGPCQRAFQVLKEELEENQLLPIRSDWEGNERSRNYDELDEQNRHLHNDHLFRLVERLSPAINQLIPVLSATSTLLGAGKQSLLRTDWDLRKRYRTTKDASVRQHGYPKLEPLRVISPPNLTQTLVGRELTGNFNRQHVVTNKFYNRIQQFSRSVGHLSAIYCMLFDKSGRYIITGADDMLVKIWCINDGRLLATLRGASAEISDLAIDNENSLIAAGSCDKIIRVWNLQTLAPVAVLSSHTGMITALQFCPAPDNEGVLVSTGGDGCVAFWTYSRRGITVKFDTKPLKMNERVRPGNAQLICASFSQGGNFLAVGGADHFVRIYLLGGDDGVDKLLEEERHQDRVDSIQWAHGGLKFATGSRDGTALIWSYERQYWKNIVLNMAQKDMSVEEIKKMQVTMVGWDCRDNHVLTTSNDKVLRVWNSTTGRLCHTLSGHEDNAYVIEAHPKEPRLVFTAGHDGQIFIWDIIAGVVVKSFKNTIEGQGYGSFFDAKWTPDGYSIAATDSHGHLVIYGMGSNEKYKKIPDELFFHTDYRPLLRDANHHILDEQTQMAPHLMPPPFLVNMDGNPYPPEFQRLVPGRDKCRDDQLVPNVIQNANGEAEVLDFMEGDLNNPFGHQPEENNNPQAPPPFASPQPLLPPPTPRPAADDPLQNLSIDYMIERLAQEQDQRMRRPSEEGEQSAGPGEQSAGPGEQSAGPGEQSAGPGEQSAGPSGVSERRESSSSSVRGERRPSSNTPAQDHSYAVANDHDPLSPRSSRVGARRVGDNVEGVRQSTGNWQKDPNMKWNRQIIVKEMLASELMQALDYRRSIGEDELRIFEEESKKMPEPIEEEVENKPIPEKKHSRRRGKKQNHSYSTRSILPTSRESEAYQRDEYEEHDVSGARESSDRSVLGSELEEEEEPESSSDDDKSTDYSDWTADAGILEPPKRTAHKQKKSTPKRSRRSARNVSGSDEDKDEENDEEDEDEDLEKEKPVKAKRKGKHRAARPNLSDMANDSLEEVPEEYRPPDWLTETMPKKAPYFPQMGDELIYFMQGHMLYVEAIVSRKKVYTFDDTKLPWRLNDIKLREQEYVKIIGMKYEIKPPRLCCLKLAIMDAGTGRLTDDFFTIKYHDMPDVLDFLILKQTYDQAVKNNWRPGDIFRCIIDDAWWRGTVEYQEPHLPDFPDSMFLCYRVLWDNGERERLSPWDMEPIKEFGESIEEGESIPVTAEEVEELQYRLTADEWVYRDPDLECDRIAYGLSKIIDLSIAEPFLVPVDLNAYPSYAFLIDYPIDLTTIKSRLENRFYRRVNAVQFDVRYIATNTERFNEKGSTIVRQARLVTDLCLELIKDGTMTDPTQLYHQLQANYQSPGHSNNEASDQEIDPGGTSSQLLGSKSGRIKNKDTRPWQQQIKDLLKCLFEKQDSGPFRYPVDMDQYPDYTDVVTIPMDLTTVREELATGSYSTPHDFAKDIRLIFTNSKNYNSNKRSKIYSMTLRLEAFFEDQTRSILENFKEKDTLKSPGGAGFKIKTPKNNKSASWIKQSVNNTSDENSEDDNSSPSTRRNRRSRPKQQSDDDSADDYSPKASANKTRTNKKKSEQFSKKNTGKRLAKRNTGKNIQYNEDENSDHEDDYLPNIQKTSSGRTIKPKKRLGESNNSDESSSSESAGPSNTRTNGQISHKGKKNIRQSSDNSDSEIETKKINGINGYSKKRIKSESEDESDFSNSSNNISKQPKKKIKIESSDNSSDESQKSKIKVKAIEPPQTIRKFGGFVPRKTKKDESEVEFDSDELQTSSDESVDKKPANKVGYRRQVGSSVRRARTKCPDGDDVEDLDFVIEHRDKAFIASDDEDATESSSESSSSSSSSDDSDVPRKKKKKKMKTAKRRSSKSNKNKSITKGGTKKGTPKKPAQSAKTQKIPIACKQPRTSNEVPKSLPPKKPRPILPNPPIPQHPYNPVNLNSQHTHVNELRYQGRVIGRVITKEMLPQEEESEGEESSSEREPPPAQQIASLGKGLVQKKSIGKRMYESDSESDSENENQNKRLKQFSDSDSSDGETGSEEESESEGMNTSSRGRVRKANTLMRDFI